MSRWIRFRLWLAQYLLRNTAYEVVAQDEVTLLARGMVRLVRYVNTSGGLCDPRRIMARKKIIRLVQDMDQSLVRLLPR